ncbi:MAG TPA: glycosyltransferase [Minicystis sp.]|nr:glycosyltransferase [Minicystis sp.]
MLSSEPIAAPSAARAAGAQRAARSPAPVRVVQVVRSLETGGQEMMLVRLVEALDPRAFACSVLVLQGHEIDEAPLARRLAERGVEVHAMRARREGVAPALVPALARELYRRGAEVVHAHNLQPLLYAGLAARLKPGTGVVATAHGYRNWSSFRFDRALRRALPGAVVVAVSPELAAALAARGFSPEVGVNGVDVEALAAPGDRARLRAALGLEPDEWVLGALGRLSPEKDHATLLRAMQRVAAVEPRAHLLLAGDGPLRAELAALAGRLGLEGRVRLIGERADVPGFLGALDVFCLPSKTEGTSLSLLEAMACGVPVVATAVGGTPSVVEAGAAARLVPPGDPEALAAALLALREAPREAAAMAARGRRIVEARFSLRGMVDRYAALYTRLARR